MLSYTYLPDDIFSLTIFFKWKSFIYEKGQNVLSEQINEATNVSLTNLSFTYYFLVKCIKNNKLFGTRVITCIRYILHSSSVKIFKAK